MKKIRINCEACQTSFDFQHPSINRAGQLENITLDCPNCKAILKMADDELTMIPIGDYMRRGAAERGIELDPDVQVGYIEIDQGDIADVISISRQRSSMTEESRQRLGVTPAVMPPHPPARKMAPEKKPFVRKPHLTQRLGDAVTPRPIKDTPQA